MAAITPTATSSSSRRRSSAAHGHHGGAWKIAFADFMTAMMAFFLVLWIINASDKETKTVIARYFNPVKLENPVQGEEGRAWLDLRADRGQGGQVRQGERAAGQGQKEAKGSPFAAESKGETKNEGAKTRDRTAEAKAKAAEAQLFAAPYEALDRIAGGRERRRRPALRPTRATPIRSGWPARSASIRSAIRSSRSVPARPTIPIAFDADARNKAPPDVEPGKTGQDEKPHAKPLPSATQRQAERQARAGRGAETRAEPGRAGPPRPAQQAEGRRRRRRGASSRRSCRKRSPPR